MIKYVLIYLFFACFVLLGCKMSSSAKDFPLTNTDWRLEALVSKPIIAGSNVHMHFVNGKIAGSSGCNQLNASYEQIGASIKFSNATRKIFFLSKRVFNFSFFSLKLS